MGEPERANFRERGCIGWQQIEDTDSRTESLLTEKSFMYMEMLYVRQKFSPKEDRKFVLQRQGRQAVR